MKILFIGCLYSQDKKELFRKTSKRGYQFAAQNFQESLLEGLCENDVDTTVLTKPSLSTWPIGSSILKVPALPFVNEVSNGKRVLGVSQGFLNIRGLNKVSYRKVRPFIQQWMKADQTQRCILVYGLHVNLMEIAIAAKREYDSLRLGIVIPDLPVFMGYNKYLKALGFQKRDIAKVNKLVSHFDAFFPLAKDMMSLLPMDEGRVKYSVIEGVFSGKFPNEEKDNHKVILYSGGLNARYGILDLLKAFELINDPDYRLWLCGVGNAVEKVKEAMARDSRICYLGQVSHDKVLQLQKQATLLVNPRHSNEEFTRYSFPSKTLEYLASGTAVVMSHLASIPKEYDAYLNYFEDESPEGMSRKIQEICSKDRKELETKGKTASSFIFSQKNPQVQVSRIVELMKTL